MAVRAAIGLGSNLGDRTGTLDSAIRSLARLGHVAAVSQYHETAPVGGPGQGDYLNAVAILDTELTARRLLEEMLVIEQEHGRERRERWGPRTLDLDLVLFGSEEIDEPGLTVPHPRMHERLFVLVPLLEAWPDATLPNGTRVESLVNKDRFGMSPGQSVTVVVVTGIMAVLLWWALDAVL